MGILSSNKSKQGAAQGTAGSQAQTGHPTSIVVSGGDDVGARINISNTLTDHGSVAESFDFGREVLQGAIALAGQSVITAQEATRGSMAELVSVVEKNQEDAADQLRSLMPWALGGLGLVLIAPAMAGKMRGR